ncbi:MAG: tRNA pseudouridine(38-40) synthase TruA [bacterium]|nr:tRNA pseudouridine(38-40) synthase TruA [bacterium]
MNNYKLIIAYNGSSYAGLQYQPGKKTIEGELREALQEVYGDNIKIVASGRTDAGVHAQGQVINFKYKEIIPLNKIPKVLNNILPEDILVKNAEIVDDSFSARRSAKSREYKYLFSCEEMPIYLREYVTRIYFKPDENCFESLKSIIKGRHDFINFRNKGSNEKSTVRNIISLEIFKTDIYNIYNDKEKTKVYNVSIVADSYLYRMVRNIVGAMFNVMKGSRTTADFRGLLDNKKERYNYVTAQPNGLCLVNVSY